MKRKVWLRRFFAARARSTHRLDREGGGHLDLDDDAFARFEPRNDPVKDVRTRQLVLATGKEPAEEPGVHILDVFEPAVGVADDVVAAFETRGFDVAVFFRFAAHR